MHESFVWTSWVIRCFKRTVSNQKCTKYQLLCTSAWTHKVWHLLTYISNQIVRWDDCICFYFLTDHVWNIKVILTYMHISAGKQISAWHRISDLIFSACRCLGCLARSLLQSCFIFSLRIWSVRFSPSPLLSSLMLFSLCLYAWFINSCHSVAQITEVLRFLLHIRRFFHQSCMAQPKQNTSQWNQCSLNFKEETEEK